MLRVRQIRGLLKHLAGHVTTIWLRSKLGWMEYSLHIQLSQRNLKLASLMRDGPYVAWRYRIRRAILVSLSSPIYMHANGLPPPQPRGSSTSCSRRKMNWCENWPRVMIGTLCRCWMWMDLPTPTRRWAKVNFIWIFSLIYCVYNFIGSSLA